jgi:hypothetical protein
LIEIQDKYYELYRSCLKTVASFGRKFKSLMNNNQSSIRWLLLRTQAIGEAGEIDTNIKHKLQQLSTRIKEIYHRTFIWNNTRFSIDGLFIYFDNKKKKIFR